MTENSGHFDEWNISKQPSFTYLPVRQMRKLIQTGLEHEALHEYCRSTNGGLSEARGVVEAIKNGESFQTPYGYAGWKTGGVVLFWCKQCNMARKCDEIELKLAGGDWDTDVVYGEFCKTCQTEVSEFHSDQYYKALTQFLDLASKSVVLSSRYPERIALGLTQSALKKMTDKFHKKFLEGSMATPEAIDYETALESGKKLLQFIITREPQLFERVSEDVKTGKALRD
jgi:hypothetical protein